MSNHDEQELLSRALRERSAGVGGHPIGLEAVRGRARSIRRRRNAVRGAVAAVVLAVAVPVGLTATDVLTSTSPSPAPPASTGSADPSPSTPAPTPRADGTFPLTLQGLDIGDPARLPYVQGNQLVRPQGTVRMPNQYLMITPYDGGYLALGVGEGPVEVVMLDSDFGGARGEVAGGYALAVSQDRSRVAYTVRQSATEVMLVNAPTDGTDPVTWTIDVPAGEIVEPVGFLDNDTVVYQDELGKTMGVARTGGELTPLDGFLRLDDTSEATGLVSGLVSYGNDGGCSGVMDPANGDLLWQSCDHSKLRFSPDGRHIVADASYSDGPGSPTLSVLDAATGDEVVTYSPDSGGRVVVGVMQAAWEDEGAVLAYVEEGREQALLRLRLDGSAERVTDVFTVQGMVVKLWFAEEPR